MAASPARRGTRGSPAPAAGRALPLLAGAAVLAVLVLLAWALARQAPAGGGGGPATAVAVPPRPVRELGLTGFDGQAFRLSAARGQLVLVNFWASWCVPCREEAGVLERGWRAYRDRGVVVLGVNVWDAEAEARSFLRTTGATYPNGTDPGGEAAIDFGVRGLPETFVVDRQGRIVRKWVGPVTDRGLVATLDELVR
jgi:cytochrome c biogenesis protein CcmG/thiol:disulfide interchange protein DsbE